MMSVLPNGGSSVNAEAATPPLHSMMSVLPNGGLPTSDCSTCNLAALDDVSATEWRLNSSPRWPMTFTAALDDVSATEWRFSFKCCLSSFQLLHSMMSVLPNGGDYARRKLCSTRAALDDVSATEWRL